MVKKSKPSRASKNEADKDQRDNSSPLPGWPGYRTREGRSGYDPIDTRTEAAHTAGTMIRTMFAGEVRKPIYLILLGLLGIILSLPLVLAILEIRNGSVLPWNAWIFLLVTGLAGLAILINFVRNLLKILFRWNS